MKETGRKNRTLGLEPILMERYTFHWFVLYIFFFIFVCVCTHGVPAVFTCVSNWGVFVTVLIIISKN